MIEGGEIVGILSVRDIVRCWTEDGAICDVPAPVQRDRLSPGAADAPRAGRGRRARSAVLGRELPTMSRRVSRIQRISVPRKISDADDRA